MARRQMSDTEYYRRDLSKRVSRLEKIVKALDAKVERRRGQQVLCTCSVCKIAINRNDPPTAEGDKSALSSSVSGDLQ